MKYFIVNLGRLLVRTTLILSLFCLLIYSIYFFSTPHIHIGGYELNNPLSSFVQSLNFWLYLLLYFITVSILNVFILFFLSIFFDRRKDRIQKIRIEKELLFTEIIIDYIFFSFRKDAEELRQKFWPVRRELRKKEIAEIFFTVLVTIQDNIDEDLSNRYNDLVDLLNLKKYPAYYLHSWTLSDRILALKIITCLKSEGHEDIIRKYSVSRNYVLRSVALDTLVKMSETDHLNILLAHEHHISILDINVLISGVEKNNKADIDYQSLLESASARTVATGLYLIKERNRKEFKDRIIPFLRSDDTFLRQVAWETFMSFAGSAEDLRLISGMFRNENKKNKLNIIRGSGSFKPGKELFDFLDEVIINESLIIKIESLKILLEKNFEKFVKFENSPDTDISTGYKEIADLNLN